jgi:signal transduction histidine kinase
MVQLYPIVVELDWLFAQLVGIWLVAFLLAIFSDLLRQHQQSQVQLTFTHNTLARQHEELVANHDNLARQKAELAAAHHQLEIIHDMTLLLQGASDIQSIQQRVLRAITTELKFSQAVLGLVNSTTRRLEGWQLYPPNDQLLSVMEPLPLNSESGFMVQELLNRRGGWWFDEPALVADEVWNEWLSQTPWLMVPLIFQEQPVGLLLVTVAGGPDSVDKEQLVVLTAVASQAAMALGTIERVQQLAVEQERNRIARDIHDTVAQSLFGTVFTLDACIKMLPGQVELVQDELIELRNLAEQVHQQVRRSILNLWPSELTINQFKTDLCQYVNHYASSPGFQIDFTIGGDFDGLSPAIRRNLYRVAQEALANVVKHAGVNSARLSLYVEPHEVQLSIRDQGKGFDPKAALTRAYDREKFGLRGVCERVEALGGECEILSQIEQGSQILVRIPTDRSNGYG